MKIFYLLLFLFAFSLQPALGQKSKEKKNKPGDSKPRVVEIIGDSIRKDSVVYYETEIGYIMPDYSEKFRGKWTVNIMHRQARAVPDTLTNSFIEFKEDGLFSAFAGCNELHGTFVIKGPTIKFTLTDSVLKPCSDEIEKWFIKLIQERVSYFGIDAKRLLLKDVAYNIIFHCARKPDDVSTSQ
jgi:heat shock protein HslJ